MYRVMTYLYFIHSLVLFPWISQFSSNPLSSGEEEGCKYSFLLCSRQNNSSCGTVILFPMVIQEASVTVHDLVLFLPLRRTEDSDDFTDRALLNSNSCFLWCDFRQHGSPALVLPLFLSFRFQYLYFLSIRTEPQLCCNKSTSPWPVGSRATPGDCHIYLPLCVLYKVCGFSAWNGNGMIAKASSWEYVASSLSGRTGGWIGSHPWKDDMSAPDWFFRHSQDLLKDSPGEGTRRSDQNQQLSL